MNRQLVSSTDISSVGYNPDSRTLEIEFNSGGIYQYFSVPQGVHDALMGANSHGKYFNQNIRDVYRCSKIN